MPQRDTARIVFDAARRVKDANGAALLLTAGRALPGTSRLDIRPKVLDRQELTPEPEPGEPPVSYCRVFLLPNGPRAMLMNYERSEADMVLRFEPLDWTMEFADLLDEPVFATGADDCVAFINGALRQRLAGSPAASPDSASGILGAFGVEPEVPNDMRAEALRGVPLRHEWGAEDGTQRALVTSPLRYCGRICGVVWSVHETYPVALRDVHQLAALSYRISTTYQHELRNTLQTAKAAIAVARAEDQGANAGLLAMLERSVLEIAERLALHARQAVPARTTLGKVSAVVAWAIADARGRYTTHGLSFEHVAPPDEPDIRLEAAGLRRAFADIFRNGAQAKPTAHVRISYRIAERTFECSVEDDGPGFPPAVLAGRVTSLDPTTPLGLSLVDGVVEAHGGFVRIGNGRNGGALIGLSFPLPRGRAGSARASVARGLPGIPASD